MTSKTHYWPSSISLLRDCLRQDLGANPRDPRAALILVSLRFTQYLIRYRREGPISYLLQAPYRLLTEFLLGLEIRPKTVIGPGLALHHSFGLVLNDGCIIGAHVTLRQGVTIGHQDHGSPSPVLQDHVSVGANAVIIGDIVIGRGARIGAGCVVTSNVPDGCVAIGVPARIREPA
jgi:putative colanic acid biosynthesis acetyltransferase WcaB